jgi:hypothetical protein
MDPKDSAFFLSVMPPFWKWLREKRGVAFSSTFFYVGACLTDTTPDLREAIQAKFYTAFNVTIPAVTAGRIFRYMVKLLARPTRSAEEVFYNVIRVVNTGQMAFKEDKILDGVLPAEHSPKGSTATPKLLFDPKGDFAMNAYFTQGGTVKPTKGVGFLDTSSYDLGQLWWLTFAGRWGQDVAQGAKNLGECYTKFWSQGRNGGLASPYCNAANTGSPPKQGEVGYAQYLLTGHAGAGVSGTVPRWTMNESAS